MKTNRDNNHKHTQTGYGLRQALASVLPECVPAQHFFTWLTGRPHPTQRALHLSHWTALISSTFAIFSGVMLSSLAVSSAQWSWLLISWVPTVHGMRVWQLILIHNASHANLLRKPKLDAALGWTLSLLLVIEPFGRYRSSHRNHHRGRLLSTHCDPSVQFLERIKFSAGTSPRSLMLRLVITLFSPRFHLTQLIDRLQSNLFATQRWLRFATVAWLLLLCIIAQAMGQLTFLLAVFLPMTVLYQQAQLLRIVVEHHRSSIQSHPNAPRAMAIALTPSMIMGAFPPDGNNLIAWMKWALSMIGAVMVRLLIMPGDAGPAHDWHHCEARGDWPNYIDARHRFFTQNPSLMRYQREVVGYLPALWECLTSWEGTSHSKKTRPVPPPVSEQPTTYPPDKGDFIQERNSS